MEGIMSFRNTFVTDFIYSASDDTVEASQLLVVAFEEWADSLKSKIDKRGYGYFAGISRTHGGSINEHLEYDSQFIAEISSITKVPFRLTFMLESNAVITYNIEPATPLDTKDKNAPN